MITLLEVLDRVQRIKDSKYDDEEAHRLEDVLRDDVLKHIAIGNDSHAKLAKAALKTNRIRFARWCA